MPRGVRTESVVNEAVSIADITDIEEASDFDALMSELPSDQKAVSLYRIKDMGRPAFLCKMLPQEFDLEMVQVRYGGGKFRVEWKTKTQIVRKHFELEGEPIINKYLNRNGQASTFVNEQRSDPVIEELKIIRERLEKAEKNGMQDRLLEMLISRNQQPTNTVDMLAQFKMMKEIFGPSHQQMDTSTIFTAMKSGMDLVADGLGGRGSDSTSKWLSIVDKYAPVLLGLVQKIAMPAPAQYNAQATVVNENGNEMKPQLSQNNFQLIAPQLKSIAPMFIAAASKNNHPGNVIETIFPLIPQDQHQTILNWLASPNWFADLCSIDNRIEAQMAWWNESFHPVMIHAIQNNGEILDDEETEIDSREM